MRTETEIRMEGMRALIGALSLVEAERFLVALSRDKFDYTEWRRHGLIEMNVEQFALAANQVAEQLNAEQRR